MQQGSLGGKHAAGGIRARASIEAKFRAASAGEERAREWDEEEETEEAE
jgi:hypothetical protein